MSDVSYLKMFAYCYQIRKDVRGIRELLLHRDRETAGRTQCLFGRQLGKRHGMRQMQGSIDMDTWNSGFVCREGALETILIDKNRYFVLRKNLRRWNDGRGMNMKYHGCNATDSGHEGGSHTGEKGADNAMVGSGEEVRWVGEPAKDSFSKATSVSGDGGKKVVTKKNGLVKEPNSGDVTQRMMHKTKPSRNGSVTLHQKNIASKDSEDDVLIEFKDVHKAFGSKKILQGASFKIRRGEAVGIIGASGTGKSTTLRLAAGLLEPDSGEVIIKGEPRHGLISDDDTTHKLKIGLVFQSGALFDSLTVKENVGFMLLEHTHMSAESVDRAVSASLAKVGLYNVENLYPSELSGGMRKRVALARAIITDIDHDHNENESENHRDKVIDEAKNKKRQDSLNPFAFAKMNGNTAEKEGNFVGAEQLIMYDEPTAGLDPVASTVIEDLIRSMHDPNGSEDGELGISSYVVVTHQHSTIRRTVDRIIFLHGGRVVWEGTVDEFDTTDEPIVRQFASGSLIGPIVYV